jgi:hypothetical protein
MHLYFLMSISRFPRHLIRLQMELRTSVWIRNPFSDDFHQGPIVELSANELAGTGIFHPAMKRYLDLHVLLPPPGVYIQPLACDLIRVTVPKPGKDRVPLCTVDIFWIEMRISDNIDEIFELRLGLLKTAIPVPVSQKE